LKQLQETKHGGPFVDDDDVPDELKSTSIIIGIIGYLHIPLWRRYCSGKSGQIQILICTTIRTNTTPIG